ncbi:NB-ARC domain-containing protein [Mesorhizobium jarvisii]
MDSTNGDGKVVVEYSDRKDYFSGDMDKARGDLAHALGGAPRAEKIFLLSGQPSRPQIAQDFERAVLGLPEMAGRTLYLWGAVEIATQLVDHLILSDAVVRKLSPYLPDLERIREEEAASRLVPEPLASWLPRDEIDAAIADRLKQIPVLAIGGVGGLGKTATAQAFAHRHQDEYEVRIWLDGDEIRRVDDLQAVPLLRAGESRNIVGLMQTLRCLLVIDDAPANLDMMALERICGKGTHVLLTRRSTDAHTFNLPMLDRSQSWALLGLAPVKCPEAVFDTIWRTVKGHPLTLSLILAAVNERATWDEILEDCEAIGEMEAGGRRLTDVLLERLRPSLMRELSVFAWSGLPVCDEDFLSFAIKPLGIRKLKGNSLTAPDRNRAIRLHEVVHASLDGSWCTNERAVELEHLLDTYLVEASRGEGLNLWRNARVLLPKLEDMVAHGGTPPSFLFALLTTWDALETKPQLVGEPMEAVRQMAGRKPGPLEINMVIESIEQLFLYDKERHDPAAQQTLRDRLVAFDQMLQLPDLTPRETAELLHHKGKALKRLGDRAAATDLFEQVLAGPFPLHEARLQLVDLYKGQAEKEARATQLVDEMLGPGADTDGLTYSVLLGVIERLPSGSGQWRAALIDRHAASIERTIVSAANAGAQHAFDAFAALGRYISLERPEMFRAIFDGLPAVELERLQSDRERAARAEIFCEAARLSPASAAELREKARAHYLAIVKPMQFHHQRHAELLIDMGKPEDAETILREKTTLDTEWLERLMARCRLGQSDAVGALNWVDSALAKLTAERFRSEFLELRHDIRSALGEKDALNDLEAAIVASQKENERLRLQRKLDDLRVGSR